MCLGVFAVFTGIDKREDRRDQGNSLWAKKGWTDLQRRSNRTERRKTKHKLMKMDHKAYGLAMWGWESDFEEKFWEYNYPENDWDRYTHYNRRESLDPWDYY